MCICRSVSLDAVGLCTDGIHVDIEEAVLQQKRKEMLDAFDRQDL